MMSKTVAGKRVNEDIEALKHDVRRLRADVAELPSRVRLYSRSKIMRSKDRLREAAAAFQEKAKQHAHDTSVALKERGHDTAENWRGRVEHRPLASMAIAFAAGLLFATIFERKWL